MAEQHTGAQIEQDTSRRSKARETVVHEPGEREMPCPICGHPMPDLKGGKATVCAVCGFKDSCCY